MQGIKLLIKLLSQEHIMQKIFVLLILLTAPIFAEETNQTNAQKEIQSKPSLAQRYETWLYTMRGYNSREEWLKNYFMIISLNFPIDIPIPSQPLAQPHQLAIEWATIDKHKNNFYFAYNITLGFQWGATFSFALGYSIGFGGFFFDSRNAQSQGWLVGMDLELGIDTIYSDINNSLEIMGSPHTGINFRGLYRGNSGIGVSITLLTAYQHVPHASEIFSRHELSITPKIGILF